MHDATKAFIKDAEERAQALRYTIRKKAGLDGNWQGASEEMKTWYRILAIRKLYGDDNACGNG